MTVPTFASCAEAFGERLVPSTESRLTRFTLTCQSRRDGGKPCRWRPLVTLLRTCLQGAGSSATHPVRSLCPRKESAGWTRRLHRRLTIVHSCSLTEATRLRCKP